jgi:hypothetical protein
MQNKPNLLDAQMNITSVKTMNYEQITMNNANKNKPNQTQKNAAVFDDEKAAARAYDTAAKKYHGEFALLNLKT